MKQRKALFSFLLALSLLCGVSISVCAHEAPDSSRTGSITVEMTYNGAAVSGGTLTAFRVGQIVSDDENYSFGKTPEMEGFSGSYEDIGSARLAEEIADYVRKHPIPAWASARNVDGKAVFTGMELGLYLIVQTEKSDGYEPISPFLTAVPMDEDGRYVYEVHAESKFELSREPGSSGTPDTSGPSDSAGELTLPQTGQLNWPVPLLAALGLGLFAAGWALRFGGRKECYEK